jgi:hypothetical protein
LKINENIHTNVLSVDVTIECSSILEGEEEEAFSSTGFCDS